MWLQYATHPHTYPIFVLRYILVYLVNKSSPQFLHSSVPSNSRHICNIWSHRKIPFNKYVFYVQYGLVLLDVFLIILISTNRLSVKGRQLSPNVKSVCDAIQWWINIHAQMSDGKKQCKSAVKFAIYENVLSVHRKPTNFVQITVF